MLESVPREDPVALVLAGLSALMYGAGDFCGGVAARKTPILTVLLFSQAVGLVLATAAALALGQPFPAAGDLAWGALAGVSGAAGLAALYTGIATTVVAVVSPLAAVVGAAIPVLLGVATGDRPSLLAWVGIGLAVPAIAMLAGGQGAAAKGGPLRRAVLLGAVAGLGFGLFFFTISRTSPGSGLWPLVFARISTITLVLAFALVTRRSVRPGGSGLGFVLLSGALDMAANIAFLLASRSGMLTIVAVVTSLYPGPTVLLAVLFFRERMSPWRIAGLVLALVGVACISA
jgi:drug/metabolite transporter (DMT)-like permease